MKIIRTVVHLIDDKGFERVMKFRGDVGVDTKTYQLRRWIKDGGEVEDVSIAPEEARCVELMFKLNRTDIIPWGKSGVRAIKEMYFILDGAPLSREVHLPENW